MHATGQVAGDENASLLNAASAVDGDVRQRRHWFPEKPRIEELPDREVVADLDRHIDEVGRSDALELVAAVELSNDLPEDRLAYMLPEREEGYRAAVISVVGKEILRPADNGGADLLVAKVVVKRHHIIVEPCDWLRSSK